MDCGSMMMNFLLKASKRHKRGTSNIYGILFILDVGCGTGIMAENLKKSGYNVEGLSPDIYQKELFTDRTQSTLHLCCFEDFIPSVQYDCIIMSESSQYIPLPHLFDVA